jgi:preprotein translocase subunit SecA
MRIQIVRDDELKRMEEEQRRQRERELEQAKRIGGGETGAQEERKPVQRTEDKIGRNAPCPCGSGKKYKKCCGVTA